MVNSSAWWSGGFVGAIVKPWVTGDVAIWPDCHELDSGSASLVDSCDIILLEVTV